MNWQTLVLGGIIIAVTLFIIIRGIVNMKKGKGGCSCGCGGCAMKDSCHKK